jgi:anti-sigma factor RsiW
MEFERKEMTHATDGMLLALVDGEIAGTAEAGLREHLAVCDQCAGELHEMQRLSTRTHEALSLLHAPPPMLRARAALAARQRDRGVGRRMARMSAWGIAKAAMLLIALAGVAAAAIPDSPVRRALETTFTRVAQLFTDENAAAPAADIITEPGSPAVPALETTSMAIVPAEGRVRIILHAPAGAVDVEVRLVDAMRARVETATTTADVRLRSAAGRIEVSGMTDGRLLVEVPRRVPSATVEVAGSVHVYKEGERLRLTGPAGTTSGETVRFRID